MLGFKTERKRIALVGSAPSSVQLAPYGQNDWFIAACSPGAYGYAGPHSQAWFELHRWEPQVAGHAGTGQSWFSPEYVEFLTRFKGTVYMLDPLPPEIPNAQTIDVEGLFNEYGPYFFTSSLAWMLGMALATPGVEEIGLWGVDMAATEEYGTQRPGCQFFLQEAIKRGIEVTLPPESDLLQPPLFYGVCENYPFFIKLQEREREIRGRLAAAEQRQQQACNEANFLRGALDDLLYTKNTWVTNSIMQPKLGVTGNEVRMGWQKPERDYSEWPEPLKSEEYFAPAPRGPFPESKYDPQPKGNGQDGEVHI